MEKPATGEKDFSEQTPVEKMADMQKCLKHEPIRLSVALHEAGHVVYALRASATDMKYHGPTEHPDFPGTYGMAGVIIPVFPTGDGAIVELIAMARWYCAGGVVKSVLSPHLWTDDEDFTDHVIYVQEAAKFESVTVEGIHGVWKRAQQDVERDLRSPAFRKQLWELAREVEKKIPWS